MEVIVQAGEFEVMLAILKSTLTILAGWSPLVDIAVTNAMNEAAGGMGGGPPGGNRYGGGNSGSGFPF